MAGGASPRPFSAHADRGAVARVPDAGVGSGRGCRGGFDVGTAGNSRPAVAARTWQRSLAHALSGGPDPDKQEVLWRTLQSYVGMWGEQVDIFTPAVAEMIAELEPTLTESVWRASVRGALPEDAPDGVVDSQVQRWERTWQVLGEWFAGDNGQARRLRRQLRDLVAPWARNMHILMDSGGALTRRGELPAPARAIERAPDDETARRMWDTAIGVFPARHLLVAADGPDKHATPWAEADAAPITGRFREHGHRAAVGKRPNALDHLYDICVSAESSWCAQKTH